MEDEKEREYLPTVNFMNHVMDEHVMPPDDFFEHLAAMECFCYPAARWQGHQLDRDQEIYIFHRRLRDSSWKS